MAEPQIQELRRRTVVKSLLWRIIGVVWTWIGAYIILLLVPPVHRSAAVIATLIVVYHHATRMVMYYAYERIWASVAWGRQGGAAPMSRRTKVFWSIGTGLAVALIFILLLVVHPRIKAHQAADKRAATGHDRALHRHVSTKPECYAA